MTYRDQVRVAQEQAEQLREELEIANRSNEKGQAARQELAEKLAAAEKELRVLRRHVDKSRQPLWGWLPFKIAAGLAVVGIVATGVAGYRSETAGVQMSYLASPALGFCVGALFTPRRRVAGAVAGAIFLPISLVSFFQLIWPSL